MGRHPDDPELQEAKGNPGKRPETTRQRLRHARQLAKLLAKSASDSDPLTPPAVLNVRGAEAALAIWREKAQHLRDFGIFDERFDREAFAQYCVWTAEFYEAHRHVLQFGQSIMTPMTNGGEMLRRNPAFMIMDIAYQRSIELAAKFAMTPVDRARLMPMLPKSWDRRPDMRPRGVNPDLFEVETSDDAAQSTGSIPARDADLGDVGILGAFRPDIIQ